MDYQDIISMMDAEIGKLEEAGRILKLNGKADAAIKKVASRKLKTVAMPKKRVLSPDGRARIAEAQRMRWAASTKKAAKKAPQATAKKAAPKKAAKRTMSPEARKLIGDGQRKRWAAVTKAMKVSVVPATTKKAVKRAVKAAPAGAMPEAQKTETSS